MFGDFEYVTDYRDDAELRGQFDELTREVFEGFSLEPWYQSGYWDDTYVCHSLLDRVTREMVANVSVSRLAMRVQGRELLGFQVGTVATRKSFRGRGLSRLLFRKVLHLVGPRPLFLFANESVLDFYPKFGFRQVPAQSLAVSQPSPEKSWSWTPARLDNPRVCQLIRGERIASEVFDVLSPALNLFHLQAFHRKHLYLSEDEEVLLVAERQGSQLDVHGLFASLRPDPEWLLGQLSWPGCETIRYHFEPDGFGLPYTRQPSEDRCFFVNKSFPTTSRDWYFPGLAVT